MKKRCTQAKLNQSKNGLLAAIKTGCIVCAGFILTVQSGYGQAPTVRYSSPQVLAPGLAINPIAPTSSGVAPFAYSNNPVTFGGGIDQPRGLATDTKGNLYIADTYNNAIKMRPAGGGPLVTLASFNRPAALALDATGNIYVPIKDTLHKLGPSGVISIVPIPPDLINITGVAVNTNGDIYLTADDPYENLSGTLLKIPADGGPSIQLGTGSSANNFGGMTIDSKGNFYVLVEVPDEILEFPVGGNIPSRTIRPGFPSGAGIAVDKTGNIYIGGPSGGIRKIPATGGSGITVGSDRNLPGSLAIDTVGNLYFSDFNDNQIKEITAGGGSTTTLIAGTSAVFGIAVDASDNVYMQDLESLALMKYPPSGQNPEIVAGLTVLATNLIVDKNYNIYLAEDTAAFITKIPAGGGPSEPIGSGFKDAVGLAVDLTGNVYVGDWTNKSVSKIPAGGGAPVTIGAFSTPSGIAVDGTGNVYVVSGTVTELLAKGGRRTLNLFSRPTGIAVDNLGNLFVTNVGGEVDFSASGSNVATAIGSGFIQPRYLAIDGEGSLYVTDDGNRAVKKISPIGGYYINPALPAGLSFDQNTGIISGKPTTLTPAATYTVTAYNSFGSTSATVVLTIANADLASMQPNAGLLSPIFARGITNYTDTVSYTNAAIKITPAASDPSATIKVNGVAVASGSPSQAIPLVQGLNTITTAVTATDGISSKTYTVTVFRKYSNDANLSFMQPTAGMMSPIFTPLVTSYTDTVNYTNLAMEITPIAQDSLATIKVNGLPVVSGAMSQAISLNEGSNTITTVVTAPDGVTTKTFTITVFRAFSTDAYLKQVQPSAGMLSPVFNPMVTSYTDSVNNSNSSITLTPMVQYPSATLTVNGAALASGATSAAIPLAVGNNIITIVVTAPDGVTTKTYIITVNRAAFSLAALNSDYQPVGVVKALTNPALADDGLLVHQGISPNGDGINDFLVIENISQYPDNKLSIMNRDGQLIFEAKGYDNNSKVFDGHSNKNGQMQLPGTYFYQLDYMVGGITRHKTGFIVLRY